MSSTGGKANKITVIVLNMLFTIMAILVIITYSAESLFKVELDVNLTKDQITTMLPTDEYPEVDIASAIPEEGLKIEGLSVELPADMLFSTSVEMTRSLFKRTELDMTETIGDILSAPIDALVEKIQPILRRVAIQAARAVAVREARNALVSAVQLGSEKTAEEIETLLIEAGYGDEYLNSKLDNLVTLLDNEDGTTTTKEVSTEVLNMLNGLIDNVHNDENITDPDLKNVSSEDIDQVALEASINSGLSNFADEEGVINIDESIARILLNVISGEEDSNEAETTAAETTPENKQSATEELKAEIKTKIKEALPESVYNALGFTIKASAVLLLFSLFIWIYFVTKIICKTFMKDNSVKIGLPIWLGHIPGILCIIPSIGLLILNSKKATFAQYLSAELISLLTETLSITFVSSGLVATLGAILLALFSIPYCIARSNQREKKLKVKKFR